MDENKTPEVLCNVKKLTDVAQSTADALLEASKLLPSPIPVDSKLHKALEKIRSIPIESSAKNFADADVQVDVNPEQVENLMNSKEVNEWLDIAITALSVNDYQKAEQYLVNFNNVCPSIQVKMILDKIQLKTTDKNPDPYKLLINRFIEIASKAISDEDMTKAIIFLDKAEKLKVNKLQADTAEKLTECAMTAMYNDQYDVAEILLRTAWIQCHSESAKQICDHLVQGEKQFSKKISSLTDWQRKTTAEIFLKLAENLVSEGLAKVAESLLIIARYTDGLNPHVSKLLDNTNKLLYPSKTEFNVQWELYEYTNEGNKQVLPRLASNNYVRNYARMDPLHSVASYKAHYFVTMACRAFEYADNAQLALEFLKEADRIYPNNKDIKIYIEKVYKPEN